MTKTSAEPASRVRTGPALAVIMVGAGMTLIDTTIVNVAIPSIRTDLSAVSSQIEWVISGYALALGLVLVLAGRLGDIVGFRTMFNIGLITFTVASILCGVSTSPRELIGWRIAQGIGAGLLFPQISATLQILFTGRERGKAFALFGVTQGLATVIGPLLGGALIELDIAGTSWRPIFLVNVPIGIATLIGAAKYLPSGRRGGTSRALDLVGVGLLAIALVLLMLPLIDGQSAGWPAWTFVALGAFLPALAVFTWWEWFRERRGRQPLIRLGLFRAHGLAAGVAVAVMFFAGFTALFFTVSLYLQIGLKYTALGAGLATVPFALGTPVGASQSDRLSHRLGRGSVQIGAVLVLLGFGALQYVLWTHGTTLSAWYLTGPLFVAGVGTGLVIAPLINITLSHVPLREAGAAGGVVSTAQRVGSAVGIALVGVVFFTVVSNHLSTPNGPGATRDAFADALRHSLWINIALVAATLLLSPLLPKRIRVAPGE